jgi:hypothetical protein
VSLVASTGPLRGRSQRSLLVSVGTTFRTNTLLAPRWRTPPIKRQSPPPPRARTPWPRASAVRHRAMCAAVAESSLHARPSSANRPEPLPGSPRSSPRRALSRPGARLAGGRHAAPCAAWGRRARTPAQPRPPTLVQIGPQVIPECFPTPSRPRAPASSPEFWPDHRRPPWGTQLRVPSYFQGLTFEIRVYL